jgi:hypothetical protein
MLVNAHPPRTSTANYNWKPQKFRFWYDSIIDWMLANPGGSHKACAEALGRSSQSINMIVASDMFQARWAERRGQLNSQYNDAILHKTAKVAVLALDVLEMKLENSPKSIPAGTVADIAKQSLEALGFGAPKAGAPVPTQEVHVHVNSEVLASARERMRTIEGEKLAEGSCEERATGTPAITYDEKEDFDV